MRWKDCLREARSDGTNCDIHVIGTATLHDWRCVAGLAIESQGMVSDKTGDVEISEITEELLGTEDGSITFDVVLNGIEVECRLFDREHIELWFFPDAGFGDEQLRSVQEAMVTLANACGKEVRLTPENNIETAVFVCLPGWADVRECDAP